MGLSSAGSKMISVTDTSTVEEFMAAATMAERSFAAERRSYGQHDELVMLGTDGEVVAMGAGAAAEAAKPDVTDESGVMPLRVPRRPAWEEGVSAKDLHRSENKAFLTWRRALAELEEQHTSSVASGAGGEMGGVAVTPFEKNIEMWRQLWRVVERSDVVVQVVDARQPLLYRCPDLEAYAREINPLKQTMMLVNKADFLSTRQRLEWGRFLRSKKVRFAFFSAHAELKKLEDEARHASRVGMGVFVALEEGADLREGADSDGASDRGFGSDDDIEEDDPDDDGDEQEQADAAAASGGGDAAAGTGTPAGEDDEAEAIGAFVGGGRRLSIGSTGSAAEAVRAAKAAIALEASLAEAAAAAEAAEAEELDIAEELGIDEGLRLACRVHDREGLLEMLRDEFGYLRAHVTAGMMTEKAASRLQEEADRARRRIEETEAAEAAADEYGGFSSEAMGAGPEEDDDAATAAAASASSVADSSEPRRRVGFALPGGPDAQEAETAKEGVRWAPDVSDTAAASAALAELEGRKLIVGTVGYPNVGKSSVINALLGVTASSHRQKRAGVGATPGKTKHFQTLKLSDDMTLCDCPGLVFPSFVSNRAEMVVAGVLPVDEMRQHYPPVTLVCQRIPRLVLERKYGIKIALPGMADDPTRPPHARELLDSLCHMRGYMASTHAGPDHPRGSRLVLKEFLAGDLLYVHAPPDLRGVRRSVFLDDTTADRRITLAADEPLSAADMAVKASERSSGGIGWSDNVLKPSAAALGAEADDPEVGVDHLTQSVMAAFEAEKAADARRLAAAIREGSAVAAAAAGAGAGDDDEEAAFAEAAAETRARGLAASAVSAAGASREEGRTRKSVKGPRKPRRARKGQRDPDPYGTQLTEEEMLVGIVNDSRRGRQLGTGVDVRVMGGSSATPDGVGIGSSFTRVQRPFPAHADQGGPL